MPTDTTYVIAVSVADAAVEDPTGPGGGTIAEISSASCSPKKGDSRAYLFGPRRGRPDRRVMCGSAAISHFVLFSA